MKKIKGVGGRLGSWLSLGIGTGTVALDIFDYAVVFYSMCFRLRIVKPQKQAISVSFLMLV
jgi:hypothetical protein